VDEFFFFPDHGATCRIFPTDAKPGTNTFKKPLHCFIHTTNEHNEQLAEFSPQMLSQVKIHFKTFKLFYSHHKRTQRTQLAEFSPLTLSQVKMHFKTFKLFYSHHKRTQRATCRIFPTDAKPGKKYI
jgi:hypothetical protein